MEEAIDLDTEVDTEQLTAKDDEQPQSAAKQKRSPNTDQKLSDRASEYAVIQYLSTLVKKSNIIESFDFDFVEFLLENGANINNCDVTGQSPFHIVAKYWSIDVARFLLDHGAEVNSQDCFGHSPLHEACALDYVEMAEFFLQNGANVNIQTFGQKQRPIHFAAKNGSCQCLAKLLAYGADINSLDCKNRTPLQLAAEMNRSKIALILVNEGASSTIYDKEGNSALTLLTEKMPDVATQALNKLHLVDLVNRKEYFSINYLEGVKINEGRTTSARTPLEMAVKKRCFFIVMHPVVQRLITLKWDYYGKSGAIFDLMLNLTYTILWTILSLALCYQATDIYLPLGSKGWLLGVVIVIIIMTVNEIRKQIKDTFHVRETEKDWIDWRVRSLEEDLGHCHPGRTEEWKYLSQEVRTVQNQSTYFNNGDGWIYFDWLAFLLVITTIISHVVFLKIASDMAYKVHRCILIKLLLVLWIRIAKFASPFQSTGTIVVIFSHIIKDVLKYSLLFAILFIPYACAFWLTFGPFSSTPAHGYDNFADLLYSMLCMVVGVDFPFDDLVSKDPFMARILCGSFIITTAIIVVNLLIALLSDTFTRFYSNAVENAVMQRAKTILQMERTMRKKQKRDYYKFVRENCSPQVVSMDLENSSQFQSNKANSLDEILNEIKTLKTTVDCLRGKSFSSQLEGNTSDSMKEILIHNRKNTAKIDKILSILATKKQADPNQLTEREDNQHYPEKHRKVVFEAENIGISRRRFSSLGCINEGFEHTECTDIWSPRSNNMINDIMGHRRSTLRRHSSVPLQVENFVEPAMLSGSHSIARRYLYQLNRKDSHSSNGSVSL